MIEKRYSVTGLRTTKLIETINEQAKAVLDKLFYPKMIKY